MRAENATEDKQTVGVIIERKNTDVLLYELYYAINKKIVSERIKHTLMCRHEIDIIKK